MNKEIDSKISEGLKNAVSQLKADVDNAFAAINSSGIENDANTNVCTWFDLSFYLYLLNIKEKQIDRSEKARALSYEVISLLTNIFLDKLDKNSVSLQSVMDKFAEIMHSKAVILWLQTEESYKIYSSYISSDEGYQMLISLLPILSGRDESSFSFESNNNYFLAHTSESYLGYTYAIIFANRYDENYTAEEEELGISLSEVLFKLGFSENI